MTQAIVSDSHQTPEGSDPAPPGTGTSTFLKQVSVALLVVWGMAAYPLSAYGYSGLGSAAAAGCGIALFNALTGCLSAIWGFGRPHTEFLKALFGGMAIRLLLMGALFGALLAFTSIDRVGLTASLFLFYVLFQVLEIRFLLRALKHRGVPPAGPAAPTTES